MAPGYEFRLLGRFEARWRGTALDAGRRRERLLLTVLLLEANAAVPVDRLVDLLWDEDPPAAARSSIHSHISRLRALLDPLGDGSRGLRLLRSGAGYLLEVDPAAVDALRFRALLDQARAAPDAAARAELYRSALALWSGPDLGGIDTGRLRDRLGAAWTELRLGAHEAALENELAGGRHRELVGELTALAAEHPDREQPVVLLMTALYRCGRPAEALAAYRKARERWAHEFGLEPGPALQRLHGRILSGDSALLAPEADEAAAGRDRDASVGPSSAAAAGASASASSTEPGPAAAGSSDGSAPDTPGQSEPSSPAAPRTADTEGAEKRAVPRQLPAAHWYFAGRADALQQLDQLLDAADGRRPALCTISGTAGVGKTTLAVHWAQRVADRFPDGQLYVNLRGFDPGSAPLAPAEALRGFLDALDVAPQRVPATADGMAALYRSMLADRRMLVLLDNARDADQVRPLLPGGRGCLTLVTSRDELTGLVVAQGAAPVRLAVMSPQEARELFARRLGPRTVAEQEEAVAQLAQACALLPLALGITAARAAARPALPLAALAAQLDDAGADEPGSRLDAFGTAEPATDPRSVFSWSTHQLAPEPARMFRLLGVCPGADVSVEAAAELADLPPGRARAVLDELVQASLLVERAPGRFTMHDLLRAYAAQLAREQDEEEQRVAALHRVVGWYLHGAAAALASFEAHAGQTPADPAFKPNRVPSFRDTAAADAWLTAELANAAAAQQTAAEHGFGTACWQLPLHFWHYFMRFRLLDQWLEMLLTGLSFTRTDPDPTAPRRVLSNLALCRQYRGELEEAVAANEQALPYYAPDEPRRAAVLNNLAFVHLSLHRYDEAERRWKEALALARAMDDQDLRVSILSDLGQAYTEWGRIDDGLEMLNEAYEITARTGAEAGVYALVGLAELHNTKQEYEKAAEYSRIGLEQARALRHGHLIGAFEWHRGTALNGLGDPAAARAAWLTALESLEQLGIEEHAAMVREALARQDAEAAAKSDGVAGADAEAVRPGAVDAPPVPDQLSKG